MKLSLIQMNATDKRDENVERACKFIDQAAQQGPDLIVLPEMFNSFYFAQYRNYKYLQLAEQDNAYTITRIKEKARQYRVNIIATIYEEESLGIYFDTAMVIDDHGQIIGKYRKTHPAAFRSVEVLYFRYGSRFPVFTIKGWKVGIAICYDLFFPEPARCLLLQGAELLVAPFCCPSGYLGPSASNLPSLTGPTTINNEAFINRWGAMLTTRAFENTVYLAACSHTGQEKEAVFAGGTRILDPRGDVVVSLGEEEGVITAELDRDLLVQVRQTNPFLRDRRPNLYKAIVAETEDLI